MQEYSISKEQIEYIKNKLKTFEHTSTDANEVVSFCNDMLSRIMRQTPSNENVYDPILYHLVASAETGTVFDKNRYKSEEWKELIQYLQFFNKRIVNGHMIKMIKVKNLEKRIKSLFINYKSVKKLKKFNIGYFPSLLYLGTKQENENLVHYFIKNESDFILVSSLSVHKDIVAIENVKYHNEFYLSSDPNYMLKEIKVHGGIMSSIRSVIRYYDNEDINISK